MSDISTQDVFELALVRAVNTTIDEHPSLAYLWWRAPLQGDRLVQVYVNDVLYDVSDDPEQRDMWLILDREKQHRIELLAVPISLAWTAQPDRLACWFPTVKDMAQIAVLRDERLPIDTQLTLTVDSQTLEPMALWTGDMTRSGFGALFGEGAFGFDNSAGLGAGQGELGFGPLGNDGRAWFWRHDHLTSGDHRLVLSAHNIEGQSLALDRVVDFTLGRLPNPASTLAMQTDFTLTWTPSHA